MATQLKAKPCKKFGAFLWNHRKMNEKQQKVVQLQRKKLNTKKLSNFAIKFKAKQLVTTLYGQIRFQQFKQLSKRSEKYQGKVTHVLFSLLEIPVFLAKVTTSDTSFEFLDRIIRA